MHTQELMIHDIYAQPALIESTLRDSVDSVQELALDIQERRINLIIIAARGTSDHAALYAKYLLEINLGIPVCLAAPSVYTLYGSRPCGPASLVLGISQSGQGADIAEVLAQARQAGALTACITNSPGSRITQTADHVLLCNAGEEIAVAATKTYTTSLALVAMLVGALMPDKSYETAIQQIPSDVSRALETHSDIREVVGNFRSIPACAVLARGLNHATAFETALKLTETCSVFAKPWSGADFQHGPIGLVDESFPCILFAPLGRSFQSMQELAQIIHERGGQTLIFTPSEELLAGATFPIRTSAVGDERMSPISTVVAGQLLAYELAILKGLNPDRPRGLTKVTSTR